ncbi:DinB family protein [Mucilaginibacter sp. BJC16-A38]|uniref:DinB family protein n=1 Tax=Mucilaginibacter phenanthrenivorans TaxID=1234842 RepID=UPI002157B33E|nr:DinB family protein [Mucilaginibacter phenanthrenivorans]MCR8556749.1 DinB family protein [Mucilaginibacter phenanthrenivorans]
MENNQIKQQTSNVVEGFTTSVSILNHWQGHRRLTRQVIEAFPEDKLFNYSIGEMRSFGMMVKEIIGIADAGLQELFQDEPTPVEKISQHSGTTMACTKDEILSLWDDVTYKIDTLWPLIPQQRFQEVMLAFGAYEGVTSDIILYWIDNEIHHRAQGYVYLRSLGIEPPAFWNRN